MPLVESSLVIRKTDPDEHERKVEAVKTALKSGAHLSTAAAYAGVASGTLAKWVKEGQRLREILEAVTQAGENREPSSTEWELIWLAEAVEQAEASAEQRLVQVVSEAAEEDWRAAMALLERRWKGRWAKRSEVTGADGGALQVEDVAAQRRIMEDWIVQVAERLGAAEMALEDGQGAEVIEIRPDREDQVTDREQGQAGST